MDKKIIRKQVLAKRKALTLAQINDYSLLICDQLRTYLKGNIALYHAYGSEVKLDSLFNDYEFALPKVIDDTTIAFYMNTNEYIEGSFKIKEPLSKQLVLPKDIDVMVIPLVAFDDKLNRMGHGKGYYDRYLKQTNCLKIGVGFECQKVDALPCEDHDIPLDIIISEKHIYKL